MRRLLFSLLLLWLVPSLGAEALHAQTEAVLPADLLFSTGAVNADGLPAGHNVLARLDAATGQISTFYSDDAAVYLKALAWSPAGDRLAFIRAEYDGKNYSAQLCLLDHAGAALGCFADAPVGYFAVYTPNDLSWSADGERLYYVGGDAQTRRLLEADAATLTTRRSLYEYTLTDSEKDNPPALAWTSDLGFLTLGAGDHTRVQRGLPVQLIALADGATTDLAQISGTAGSSQFVVCPYFSPQGTYLTAYNFDVPETPAEPQFLLLNTQGALVATIQPTEPLNVLPQSCPAWQADETAFYFPLTQGGAQASTLRILKYTLTSQQFSAAFAASDLPDLTEATVISPLTLAPGEQFAAFTAPFAPAISPGTQVTVVGLTQPEPLLRRYSAPFSFSSDALWSPRPAGEAG